jgi:ubiquinone/menaquinone biosynthesis C-methylase UbiE
VSNGAGIEVNRPKSTETSSPIAHVWKRLVNRGFHMLYHELARIYDVVAWTVSTGQWQAWGQSAVAYVAGERVLELGHGPGHLLITLAESGFQAVGLDPSTQMSQLARRRVLRSGVRADLARAHAQSLPFADRAFDSIVATFPTDYIVHPATLSEIARVLSPEGRLVAVLGARLVASDPISRTIEWLYKITGQREPINAEAWTSHFHSAGLIARLIQIDARRSQVCLLLAEPIIRDDKG